LPFLSLTGTAREKCRFFKNISLALLQKDGSAMPNRPCLFIAIYLDRFAYKFGRVRPVIATKIGRLWFYSSGISAR
jgi:hypothetical protein